MTQGKNKQGVVTEENLDEARRLRAIWDRKRSELRTAGQPVFSQESFGADFKVGNQAAVGFFLNGKTALSFKAASGFAKGLGCRIADFSPRLAEMGEAVPAAAPAARTADAAQEQGTRLALAFAALPDALPDGSTRAQLFEQLMRQIQAKREAARAPAAPSLLQTEDH